MNTKLRYSLLGVGFVAFVILAPLIVLYVRGITYDFSTGRFVKTGILSIQTDPKSVNAYLNGKLSLKSSGNVKFLKPGEYDLTIKKDGYFDWVKRVSVYSGAVTWVYPAYTKIFLLKNNSQLQNISADVLDFYQNGQTFAYITSKNFVANSPANLAQSQNYLLPLPVSNIAASGDGNFVLTSATGSPPTALLFNTADKTFTNLSPQFKSAPLFEFDGADLYALDGQNLYAFDSTHKAQLLFSNVLGFSVLDKTLYYVWQNRGVLTFSVSQPPFVASQTVLSGLPAMQNVKILIDSGKHGFILAGSTLYQVGASLEKLADGVTGYSFNEPRTQLAFVSNGELHQYDPATNSDVLITRAVAPIQNIDLSTNYNYAFYFAGNILKALDLNTNSPRNEYSLYTGQSGKFTLDSQNGNIFLLDGGNLKILNIR